MHNQLLSMSMTERLRDLFRKTHYLVELVKTWAKLHHVVVGDIRDGKSVISTDVELGTPTLTVSTCPRAASLHRPLRPMPRHR